MAKGIITSTGRIIDLDSGSSVQDLPPENLQMEKRSYGFNSSPFSVLLKNRSYIIQTNFNQWYCSGSGKEKCIREIKEMNLFPFPCTLSQDLSTGDLSYLIFITVNCIRHDVLLTYDYDHPDYEMRAFVISPQLDMSVMTGHSYGQNKPCYIENWSRKYRAIQCAMQVTFWLNDYYKKRGQSNTSYQLQQSSFSRIFDQMQKQFDSIYRGY